MRDLERVRVVGPLALYVNGFREELGRRGYSPFTAVRYLQLMGNLSRWLADSGLDDGALTTQALDAYAAWRRKAHYRGFSTVRSMAPLVEYLRGRDVVPPATLSSAVAGPVEDLLSRYAHYLGAERGLAEVTIRRRVQLGRPVLCGWMPCSLLDLQTLTASDVSRVVLERAGDVQTGSAASMVTSLRSLLGFLHVEGLIDRPLVSAVPSVAAWKLTGLPKAVPAEQVAALLASCDHDTVAGRRDFAILTVLVRLGLRAGEVAGLGLRDVDWPLGQITIRGKGNRLDVLPLPVDVGEAIVAYLQNGHPGSAAAGATVFARVRAPQGRLTRGAVSQVVANAADRCGFDPIYAHRLRHTAATGMLRAGGSLGEVGQVLRHRRTITTAIYAKVDTERLRALARPWPLPTVDGRPA